VVEEIVRWTTPVIQFCRTASEDTQLRGQTIRAGESLYLAFGSGEHFCLGASLARLELRVAFAKLAEHLCEIELAGPVSRLHSSFVGGIKRVPIRYRLEQASRR